MKTITNWVKGINTKLKKAPRLGIWKVLYLPEFRRVILHGDGLPLFKGVISKDGKFVFVEFIVQRVPRLWMMVVHSRISIHINILLLSTIFILAK